MGTIGNINMAHHAVAIYRNNSKDQYSTRKSVTCLYQIRPPDIFDRLLICSLKID